MNETVTVYPTNIQGQVGVIWKRYLKEKERRKLYMRAYRKNLKEKK